MRILGNILFLSFLLFSTACGDSRTGSENQSADIENRPEHGAVEGAAAGAGQQRE